MPDSTRLVPAPVARPRADLLFSRAEAARRLEMSLSTLEVAIAHGLIKTHHRGRRVFIRQSELERFAKRPLRRIWPPRLNGKTTRHYTAVAC